MRASDKASFGSLELWTEKNRGKSDQKIWKKSDLEIREDEKSVRTESVTIEKTAKTKTSDSM